MNPSISKSPAMTLVRILLALLGLALTVQIGVATSRADFMSSFAEVAADLWGLVGLLDLYLGFVVAAVLLVWLEPRQIVRWPMIVALFLLGNPLLALWAAWRLPEIARRLSHD